MAKANDFLGEPDSKTPLTTGEQLDEYIKNSKGYLFVKFGTPWCGPCKAMERDMPDKLKKTFGEGNFEFLSIDINKNPKTINDSKEFDAKHMTIHQILPPFEHTPKVVDEQIHAIALRMDTDMNGKQIKRVTADLDKIIGGINKLKEGEMLTFTFDGTYFKHAALKDGKVTLYDSGYFTDKDGKIGWGVPTWAIFKDGKRVMQGGAYESQMMDFILKSVVDKGRAPTDEEWKAENMKNAQNSSPPKRKL